jgi:hypothetical protein
MESVEIMLQIAWAARLDLNVYARVMIGQEQLMKPVQVCWID